MKCCYQDLYATQFERFTRIPLKLNVYYTVLNREHVSSTLYDTIASYDDTIDLNFVVKGRVMKFIKIFKLKYFHYLGFLQNSKLD